MSLNCLNGDDIYVIKKKCDCESRQKIMRKLTEMKDVNDVNSIGCTFSEEEIKFDSISKSKTKEEIEMWKYLSKLSIYLYNDYEFFSPLILKQNSFDNEVFKSEMERLGYIRKANAWFQKQEPEEEVIISNIFNYCLIRFIFNSNQMILTRCTYCNNEVINGKCTICGFDIEDTVRTNEDDTVRDYKQIDSKDRMKSDNETIDVCQENKSKIMDKINSVENNQSNIGKNNKGNHESRDEETQTEVTDTCTNSSCLSGSIKVVDTHSKKCNKDYLSMDGDEATRNNNNSRDHSFTSSESFDQDNINSSQNKKSTSYRNTQNETFKHRTKEIRGSTIFVEDGGNKDQNHTTRSYKSSDQPQFWICKSCTFRNTNFNSLNCDICEKERRSINFTFQTRKFDETSCVYCDGDIVDGKCTICNISLFKNDQTNYDDWACNYKSIDVKERALSGIHTQDTIKCHVEGSSNNQRNDETNKEEKHQSMEEIEQTFDRETNSLVFSLLSRSKHTAIKSNKTDNRSSLNENRSYKHMQEKHKIKKMKIDSEAPAIVTNYTEELFLSHPPSNSRDHLSKPKESFDQDNINSSQNKKSTSYRNTQNDTFKHRTKDGRGSTTLAEDGGNKDQTHSTRSYKSSDQSEFWICDNCTFRNTNLNSLNCEVCEKERRSINLEYKNKEDLSKNCKTKNMNIINQNNLINYPIENKSNEKPKEISTRFKCYKCSYPNAKKCSDCRSLRIPDSKLGRSNETCVTDNEEILENKARKRDTAENITKNTKSEDKWTCNSCTFLNPLSSKMCEICMTINEGSDVGRDLEVPEETWICRQCKTSNSFDRYKCSNCKELADFFNKWVCERCRFFNDKLANKCVVCENKNPNIVKCSQCKEKRVEKNERCRDCLQKSLFQKREIVREKTQKWDKETSEKKEESVELMEETGGAKFTKIIKTDSVDFKELKRCPNFLSCKGKVTNNDNKWCKKCKENQWFCPNEGCGTINYLNKYCKNCKLQKDSDVSNCKEVTVLKDNKPAQMWMCGFCNKYSIWTYHRCSHCKNQRDSPSSNKCICGWNNAPRHSKCEECGAIIKKK